MRWGFFGTLLTGAIFEIVCLFLAVFGNTQIAEAVAWEGFWWFVVVAGIFLLLGIIPWGEVPEMLQRGASRAQPHLDRGIEATEEWIRSSPAAFVALLLGGASAGCLIMAYKYPRHPIWAYSAYFCAAGTVFIGVAARKGWEFYQENAWWTLAVLCLVLAIPSGFAGRWDLVLIFTAGAIFCSISAAEKWDAVGEGVGKAIQKAGEGLAWLFAGPFMLYSWTALLIVGFMLMVAFKRGTKTAWWSDQFGRVTYETLEFYGWIMAFGLFLLTLYHLLKHLREWSRRAESRIIQ